MPANRRHHFVPKFLLRRFAVTEGRWQGHIWRLDKATGQPRIAVPRTEAAKGRYYEIPSDLIGEDFQPERVLATIENGAASAIRKFERAEPGQRPPGLEKMDIDLFAYFTALQTVRTPADRRERAYLDGIMERQITELRLSAQDKAVEHIQAAFPGISVEEAEQRRKTMLDDLRAGRVWFESPAERQVASMFLALNESVEELIARCDWTFVRFPEPSRRLVLSDRGVTVFDSDYSGVGGVGPLTSSTTETVVAVSPRAAIVITPGNQRIAIGDGSDDLAADFNLRAYASSENCIYGCSQPDVVETRRHAKRDPRATAERRRRARTLWFAEKPPNSVGTQMFTGHSIDGTRTATFRVDPRAYQEGPVYRAEDFWPTPEEEGGAKHE